MPTCGVCGHDNKATQTFRMIRLDDGMWVAQCRECEARGDTAPPFVRDLERIVVPDDERLVRFRELVAERSQG